MTNIRSFGIIHHVLSLPVQASAPHRGSGVGDGNGGMPEDGSQPVRTGTRYNILVPTKEHKLCKCGPICLLATT